MAKTIGKREARRLAFDNIAGLVDNMDLEQVFGPTEWDEDDESLARLEQAKNDVAEYLRRAIRRSHAQRR